MKKWILVLVALVAGIFFAGWLIQQNPKPAIVIYHLLPLVDPYEEPPFWLQRIEQRQEVNLRVQSAGGWDALRSDCLRLVRINQTNYFLWNKFQTNQPVLPPAIAALQPVFVQIIPRGNAELPFVDITLYGTGEGWHRGVENYGLEVICGPPFKLDEPRLHPNCTYRKIEDGIYEDF